MNTVRFALSISLVAALTGCGASTSKGGQTGEPGTDTSPTVSATANVTTGVAPLTVDFTGVAAGGNGQLSYEWDFGDGDTDTDLAPSHTFIQNGTFNAKFTATDEDGDFASATVTINVGTEQVPAVTAAADVTSGLAPLPVQFTATVVGGDLPVTVSWNFGDGETSAETSPLHTFNAPGTYGATVTATDATGDAAQATVLITVGSDKTPVVAISANPTAGAAPLPVAFTANIQGGDAPLSYEWTFGDATTANTANANHTYTADGSYQAKLTVTDADGDAASANVTIVVNSNNSTEMPDLRIGAWDAYGTGLDDVYEPNNGDFVYYLGDYTNSPYSITDGYIDEVDVTWFVDVVNFGKTVNTPFYVDFYQNAPAGPGATAFGDEWTSVASLQQNSTQRLYFNVFSMEPGVENHSYARIDLDNDVEESDETNNLSNDLTVTALPDEDWFAIHQDAGFDITLALSSLPADYDLEIWDDIGFLAESANAGTTSESILVTAPATGLYYIRVFGYNGARDSSDAYTLDITVE